MRHEYLYKQEIQLASKTWRTYVSDALKGFSSVGRATVSKTVGQEFEPLSPCQCLQGIRLAFKVDIGQILPPHRP